MAKDRDNSFLQARDRRIHSTETFVVPGPTMENTGYFSHEQRLLYAIGLLRGSRDGIVSCSAKRTFIA